MSHQENIPFQFPEVRVVEASAGSGKTYALAKRYVQLLLNPALKSEQDFIRSILAITFTNKAAFEMKERILEFLRQIAFQNLSTAEEQDILQTIAIDKETASQKAYQIMDEIIRHYHFFQVQTMDSFINALLSGCAFKIDRSANFQIKTNAHDYLEMGLDRLIDTACEDPKIFKIFESFLHQYLFIENRSGWFPKKDILALLSQLFQQTNTFGQPFRSSGFKKDHLIKQKLQLIQILQQMKTELPETVDKRFFRSLEQFLDKYSNNFVMEVVSDYFTRDALPVRKGTEVSNSLHRLWEKARAGFQSLSDQEARTIFDDYIEVFQHVSQDFKHLARQDDILFLEELNKEAQMLFADDQVTVEELYYRMATRFKHYLIDEFQDTSILQWQNFVMLIEEALSTGGSLFYVGDKKQAIYGFRGGEVMLFDAIKQRLQSVHLKVQTLEKNYRSQKEVVEFNNHVFSAENLRRFIEEKEHYEIQKKKKNAVQFREEDIQQLLSIFHGAQQEYREENQNGYVKIEPIEGPTKEDRAILAREKLMSLLPELRKRFQSKEIAILVRGNKDAEMITSWLLEEGFLVDSERTSNIKENPLIKELVSLLDFLNSPIDNLAFASFILGDIFTKASGMDLAEIRQFVFRVRETIRSRQDTYLYKAFREQYPKIWEEFFDEFFRNVGLYPLYELVLSLLHRFQCMEHFPEYQGFLMRFLELIKEQEDDHADMESFLEFFAQASHEDLYVKISKTDAIKVLTIHKAKGLEFPVVIVPFLGLEVQVGSIGGVGEGQKSYVVDVQDEQLNLLHLKNKYLSFSTDLKNIHKREYIKSLLAELSNIYVALTRTGCELYAFIPNKIGQGFNLANFLLPDTDFTSGTHVSYSPKSMKEDVAAQPLPASQYKNWLHLLKDEFVGVDRIRDRASALRGDILHFILSYIGNLAQADVQQTIGDAIAEAQRMFPLLFEPQQIRGEIEALLDQKSLKPFFFIEDAEVFQEKELVNRAGQTKRLDRLIVKKEDVWILDYKSSRGDIQDYQQQVQEYMGIIKELYPKKKVRGFLLFLDRLTVEEVYEPNHHL